MTRVWIIPYKNIKQVKLALIDINIKYMEKIDRLVNIEYNIPLMNLNKCNVFLKICICRFAENNIGFCWKNTF